MPQQVLGQIGDIYDDQGNLVKKGVSAAPKVGDIFDANGNPVAKQTANSFGDDVKAVVGQAGGLISKGAKAAAPILQDVLNALSMGALPELQKIADVSTKHIAPPEYESVFDPSPIPDWLRNTAAGVVQAVAHPVKNANVALPMAAMALMPELGGEGLGEAILSGLARTGVAGASGGAGAVLANTLANQQYDPLESAKQAAETQALFGESPRLLGKGLQDLAVGGTKSISPVNPEQVINPATGAPAMSGRGPFFMTKGESQSMGARQLLDQAGVKKIGGDALAKALEQRISKLQPIEARLLSRMRPVSTASVDDKLPGLAAEAAQKVKVGIGADAHSAVWDVQKQADALKNNLYAIDPEDVRKAYASGLTGDVGSEVPGIARAPTLRQGFMTGPEAQSIQDQLRAQTVYDTPEAANAAKQNPKSMPFEVKQETARAMDQGLTQEMRLRGAGITEPDPNASAMQQLATKLGLGQRFGPKAMDFHDVNAAQQQLIPLRQAANEATGIPSIGESKFRVSPNEGRPSVIAYAFQKASKLAAPLISPTYQLGKLGSPLGSGLATSARLAQILAQYRADHPDDK